MICSVRGEFRAEECILQLSPWVNCSVCKRSIQFPLERGDEMNFEAFPFPSNLDCEETKVFFPLGRKELLTFTSGESSCYAVCTFDVYGEILWRALSPKTVLADNPVHIRLTNTIRRKMQFCILQIGTDWRTAPPRPWIKNISSLIFFFSEATLLDFEVESLNISTMKL